MADTFLPVAVITTAEAAVILKISPVRVRQLIKDGRIKAKKLGRDHLLNQDEVERFAKNGRLPHGRPRKEARYKTLRMR